MPMLKDVTIMQLLNLVLNPRTELTAVHSNNRGHCQSFLLCTFIWPAIQLLLCPYDTKSSVQMLTASRLMNRILAKSQQGSSLSTVLVTTVTLYSRVQIQAMMMVLYFSCMWEGAINCLMIATTVCFLWMVRFHILYYMCTQNCLWLNICRVDTFLYLYR